MICKLYILTIVIFYFLKNYKCDYISSFLKAKVEDIVIDFVNDTYFDEDTFDISINYESESQNFMTTRIDIIEDLPQLIFLKCTLWGHAFGHYNVPTGIQMEMNMCNNKLKDYFFNIILAKMHLDEECPAKKGKYENTGFETEIGGFPLTLPAGFRFLLEADSYSKNITLIKVKAYLVVL